MNSNGMLFGPWLRPSGKMRASRPMPPTPLGCGNHVGPACSPTTRRWSWRRGVLPASKRVVRGRRRARRQMELLIEAVRHRWGNGGGFGRRGSDDDEVQRWPAAVREGSCGTGEWRGRLGTANRWREARFCGTHRKRGSVAIVAWKLVRGGGSPVTGVDGRLRGGWRHVDRAPYERKRGTQGKGGDVHN
jgi:hypothetical protein